MSIAKLRRKYIKLKKNKINTKALMLELLANSSKDYTPERMYNHLYKCGMTSREDNLYKWFLELEQSGEVVFVGHMPVYTEINKAYIGTDPVFGLVTQK